MQFTSMVSENNGPHGLFAASEARHLLGDSSPNGRVTVDPYWTLKSTPPIYGNSFRGPYKYYTDGTQIEYEVPSIKSINWNRSNNQDLGSCTIVLYNSWHNLNLADQDLAGQLGHPGYFWPKRGQNADAVETWHQSPGSGAYRRNGVWDPTFSWSNVLVEDVILRTYEGYGGRPQPEDEEFISIDDNIENDQVVITGIWIVNTVTASSDGLMTLECTDIGRILLDQIVFPPVIPPAVYPLEYFPAGKDRSSFASPWGPKVRGGVTTNEAGQTVSTSPASRGEVWSTFLTSTAIGDATVSTSYPGRHAVDGNWDTYALSEAYDGPQGGAPWFEFVPGGSTSTGTPIDAIQLKTWAGGYTVYVSVLEESDPRNPTSSNVWKGSGSVPGSGISYVAKIEVPLYLPDGLERPYNIDFKLIQDAIDRQNDGEDMGSDQQYRFGSSGNQYTYYAKKVRLTFENLYYSHVADGTKRYRCGIRDLIFYRNGTNVGEFSPSLQSLPWTFAMEQHPVRGYWVADTSGNVYGFGDAADFDSTGFGPVPISDYGSTNRAVGIAAHPSGEGYWVVDWMGHVFAYGRSQQLGWEAVPDPYTTFADARAGVAKPSVRGIAATHTGDGYWVVYSNGIIRGFGDASPSYSVVPSSDVATFMDWFLRQKYSPGKYVPYNVGLKATSITAHPTKMGFWVTDGSGQVFAFGEAQHQGELRNRVYGDATKSDGFQLQPLEWATSIESTTTGNGYWIAFGSGRVAAFGDATKLGKTPYVFDKLSGSYSEENQVYNEFEMDYSFFREILWSLARDPDGDGFWVLKADGSIKGYRADFWGKPSYSGVMPSGFRWHEGNFSGDWMEVVRDLLMWGGFTYYDPDLPSDEAPAAFGMLESTGIATDTEVQSTKLDKRTLLDIIKELAQVTAYDFRITNDGRALFRSPNWWRAGNFDEDGFAIRIDPETLERVDPEVEGNEPFIPLVHEDQNLLTYSVTLSHTDKKSELIIGNDLPDPKDPSRTAYIRYNPPSSLETVAGGVNTMRGIPRVGLWTSQIFENEEERRLMAELISLRQWFAGRAANATIVANPCLTVGDQVRIIERTTSETFIHLIMGLSSSMDLDSGAYTMNLTTYWLGNADDWVIKDSPEDTDFTYTVISDRVNTWQLRTERGLGESSTSSGVNVPASMSMTGQFVSNVAQVQAVEKLVVLGDSLSYLDSTLDGLTGDRWPNLLEDWGSVETVYNGAMSGYTTDDLINDPIVAPGAVTDIDALVIFVGANDQNYWLSGVSVEEFGDNIQTLIDDYPASKVVVVFPWPWTGFPE